MSVWLVLSSVYSYFLANFATFASTYAGLSGLFAAMFLIYLSALALILGGELNRVIALARKFKRLYPKGGPQQGVNAHFARTCSKSRQKPAPDPIRG